MYSYRVPAYYDYRTVVERTYCPPRPLVYESYYERPYYGYGRPVSIYREHGWSRDWDDDDRHEWREHGHGRWHH